jgi:Domain of unknown function (DUF4148)
MNIKSAFVVAAITLATTGAFAAESTYVLTPGENLDYPYVDNVRSPNVSRSTVRQAALTDNAKHELAGEVGADVAAFDEGTATSSTLTRAQVRAQVLAARADGTLPSAGDEPEYPAVLRPTQPVRFDASAHPTLVKIDQWVKTHVERVATAGSN